MQPQARPIFEGKLKFKETRELFEYPSCFHLKDTGGVRVIDIQSKKTFNVKSLTGHFSLHEAGSQSRLSEWGLWNDFVLLLLQLLQLRKGFVLKESRRRKRKVEKIIWRTRGQQAHPHAHFTPRMYSTDRQWIWFDDPQLVVPWKDGQKEDSTLISSLRESQKMF